MAGSIPLVSLAELEQKKAITFQFTDADGISREGFVAWFKGEVRAYENRCKHLPLPLDYGDAHFFTPDGEHFVCSSHGAIYEPLSGKCIAGPCPGANLQALSIRVENGMVWLLI